MKRMTKKAIATRRNTTLQRDRFVEEYLKNLNPTQAAIRSGYPSLSNRTPLSSGESRLGCVSDGRRRG